MDSDANNCWLLSKLCMPLGGTFGLGEHFNLLKGSPPQSDLHDTGD